MELALKLMLEETGLPKEVINNVEKIGAKKASSFATYISEASEVTRFIRGMSFGDDEDARDAALSMLRLAWMTAKANLEHGLKRKASGLMEEVPEGPLPAELHQALVDTSCKFYQWDFLDPAIVCTDSIVGKTRREFQSWAHTVFPIAKATSQAAAMASHSSGGKRQRLTERFCLVDDLADPEDDQKVKDTLPMIDFLENFERLTVTWTVAGCYSVSNTMSSETDATCLYVKQHEVDTYRREFSLEAGNLRKFFTEGSSVRYLTAVEESMRGEAVKNARPPKKKPYGKSLVLAVETKASAWTKFRNLLIPRSEPTKPRVQTNTLPIPGLPAIMDQNTGGKANGKGKQPRKQKAKGGQSNQLTTADGARPCFRFNSKDGCKQKDCRFPHVCNAVLSNGFLCGQKHTQLAHKN